MIKYYQLNEQLQKIENEISQRSKTINNGSFADFIKYKKLIRQKEILKKQIKQSIEKAQDAISSYNAYNNKIVSNIKISCKKYCRLHAKAEYKRDHTLFKLGLINHKPTPPFIQNISNIFSFLSKPFIKPAKKIKQSIKNFTSNIIPKKIENVAIGATKLCIKGHRTLQRNCTFFRKHLNATKYAEYVKHVVHEAQSQINNSYSFESEARKFRSSIQVKVNSCPSPSSVSPITRKDIIHCEHRL